MLVLFIGLKWCHRLERASFPPPKQYVHHNGEKAFLSENGGDSLLLVNADAVQVNTASENTWREHTMHDDKNRTGLCMIILLGPRTSCGHSACTKHIIRDITSSKTDI